MGENSNDSILFEFGKILGAVIALVIIAFLIGGFSAVVAFSFESIYGILQ